MNVRVRCNQCRSAFLTGDKEVGSGLVCPKCGALQSTVDLAAGRPAGGKADVPRGETAGTSPSRLSEKAKVIRDLPESRGKAAVNSATGEFEFHDAFVPSDLDRSRSRSRRRAILLGLLAVGGILGVAALVLYPRVRPRPNDPVEHVADSYLQALVDENLEAQRRLGTVEEPPAIRSFRTVRRDRVHDRSSKGSFAPLAALHTKIDSEFAFDPAIGRFTPRHPLGAAAETLDAVQAAKEEAQKSGVYEKMASGDPDDIFDAAESFGKVFTKLAEGAIAPKRILPTYEMLVKEAKPPLAPAHQELAMHVAGNFKAWESLLKRSFTTLRADGPFIFEQAEVDAEVTDRLASLGDPPTPLRLSLVRFRLEGIDTGWRVIAARRIVPGQEQPLEQGQPSSGSLSTEARSPGTSLSH